MPNSIREQILQAVTGLLTPVAVAAGAQVRRSPPTGITREQSPVLLVFPESIIAPRTATDAITLLVMHEDAQAAGALVLVGETIPTEDGHWRNVVRAYGLLDGAIVDEAALTASCVDGNNQLTFTSN